MFSSPNLGEDLELFYFIDRYGGYGSSTQVPGPEDFKKMITKEEYDQHFSNQQEDMFQRRLVTDQMVAAREQAELAEKEALIAELAEKTGMSLEDLKKILL